MSQQIGFTVDTTPMAQSINSVSNHVDKTCTAVVAMQAAVVAAEVKAADHVCENVNRGFYTLIRSQITQKIAKLKSDVDSYLLQLQMQRKQLLTIKNRMEKDYNMLTSRYVSLFNGLNKNLFQRIHELDKPTFDFADKEVGRLNNRVKNLVATVPVCQSEVVGVSQQILASNVKNRGVNVIASMNSFLAEMKEQKELTDQILQNRSASADVEPICVPMIVCEKVIDKMGNSSVDFVVCKQDMSPQAQNTIKENARARLGVAEWHKAPLNPEVMLEFANLVAASRCSERVKDLAARLMSSNEYQVLSKL